MSAAPKQTEAQRLADALVRLANLEANELADCMNEAAALLLRQDELLKQALQALNAAYNWQATTPILNSTITAIRAHRETK